MKYHFISILIKYFSKQTLVTMPGNTICYMISIVKTLQIPIFNGYQKTWGRIEIPNASHWLPFWGGGLTQLFCGVVLYKTTYAFVYVCKHTKKTLSKIPLLILGGILPQAVYYNLVSMSNCRGYCCANISSHLQFHF